MKKIKNQPNCFEQVYKIVQSIPRGKVLTYGMISLIMNRRISAAGVGWALNGLLNAKGKYTMGTVPWYRVVNAQGKLSTKLYSSLEDNSKQTVKLQKTLLENEGVKFKADESLDLARYVFARTKIKNEEYD